MTGANGAAGGVVTGAICSEGAWSGATVGVVAGGSDTSTGASIGEVVGASSVGAGACKKQTNGQTSGREGGGIAQVSRLLRLFRSRL